MSTFFLDSGSRLLRKLVRNDIRKNQVNSFTPSEGLRAHCRLNVAFLTVPRIVARDCRRRGGTDLYDECSYVGGQGFHLPTEFKNSLVEVLSSWIKKL